VGRNPFLGDLVHLTSSDLNFDTLSIRADHGRVKGLVHVLLGKTDVILEFPRDGFPDGVDDPQDVVAFFDRTDDDSEGSDIIDLVQIDVLVPHLSVDAVSLLKTTGHFPLDVVLIELLHQSSFHGVDVIESLLLLLGNLPLDVLIEIWLEILEGKIFELQANPIDSQAMGYGA